MLFNQFNKVLSYRNGTGPELDTVLGGKTLSLIKCDLKISTPNKIQMHEYASVIILKRTKYLFKSFIQVLFLVNHLSNFFCLFAK